MIAHCRTSAIAIRYRTMQGWCMTRNRLRRIFQACRRRCSSKFVCTRYWSYRRRELKRNQSMAYPSSSIHFQDRLSLPHYRSLVPSSFPLTHHLDLHRVPTLTNILQPRPCPPRYRNNIVIDQLPKLPVPHQRCLGLHMQIRHLALDHYSNTRPYSNPIQIMQEHGEDRRAPRLDILCQDDLNIIRPSGREWFFLRPSNRPQTAAHKLRHVAVRSRVQ